MKRTFDDHCSERILSSRETFQQDVFASSTQAENHHVAEFEYIDDSGEEPRNQQQKKMKRNSSLSYFHNLDDYCSGRNGGGHQFDHGKENSVGFELLGCFGNYGNQCGQFKNPSDIAIDFTYQYIFISDTDNRRIQVFDESTMEFKYMFETELKPNSVTVHWDHTLIVSFTRDSIICKYDYSGKEIWKWGGISTKSIMDSPSGVVVDSMEGNIYVCDWFRHRIIVFSPTGQLLRTIGSNGCECGQFSFPRDIDLDNSGNLIVSDSGNNRIQIISSNGDFISSFGSVGDEKGEFQSPNSVFFDKSTGFIYVSEWDSHRVSRFHPINSFAKSSCVGSLGSDENSFNYPSGITFCYGSSHLYVVDCGNHRVKVFKVSS